MSRINESAENASDGQDWIAINGRDGVYVRNPSLPAFNNCIDEESLSHFLDRYSNAEVRDILAELNSRR